ncbi:MAG: hypothetical protein CL525_03450 [Aequorivita sp.]|jgi:hypothetical protein|nr:hypothetical protein [Aequorivita sp.]|tara:strand:+ start:750 stop:1532 length:783 start_codon:yes stop_codon:yes gene_type:complete
MKQMIKNIILVSAFFIFSNCFSQDYELRATPYVKCEIAYKDGTLEKGFLRLASSAFSPQFKKEENEKSRKIDFELIDKIVSNPETENERIFQYLNHNQNKFKIFVELIYNDVLSIYINSTDSDDLFYSDFDRQNIREMMAQAKFEGRSEFTKRLKLSDTLNLPNGKKIALPMRYSYYYGLDYGVAHGITPKLNYYLLKEGSTKLYKVEKNKRFIKNAKEIINNCPIILKDLENNQVNIFDLPNFIEHYKDVCQTENSFEN